MTVFNQSESFRKKREAINKIESSKNKFEIFGSNAWKMSLRSSSCNKEEINRKATQIKKNPDVFNQNEPYKPIQFDRRKSVRFEDERKDDDTIGEGGNSNSKNHHFLDNSNLGGRDHFCINDVIDGLNKRLNKTSFKSHMNETYIDEFGTKTIGIWSRQPIDNKYLDNSIIRKTYTNYCNSYGLDQSIIVNDLPKIICAKLKDMKGK